VPLVSPLYPPGLILETLQTIKLLFPQNNPKLRKWYLSMLEECGSPLPLDTYVMDVGFMDTERRCFGSFHYWHDRLLVLKQVYDESTPSTLRQLWYDDRIKVAYYTFWFAATVSVLAFIQTILTLVQTVRK
jgi:hypothetical protein